MHPAGNASSLYYRILEIFKFCFIRVGPHFAALVEHMAMSERPLISRSSVCVALSQTGLTRLEGELMYHRAGVQALDLTELGANTAL
jgi:hypothetical protein